MKQKRLFMIIGAIVLVAGLANGAGFFLNRENDRSAAITYHENGEIFIESWYLNGQLIKEKPD